MRFLIVHKNYAAETRELVAEAGVNDIEVLLMRGEALPEGKVVESLTRHPGSSVALVSINRKYRKALVELYEAQVERTVETIKGARSELLLWLRGTDAAVPVIQLPSEAFWAAAKKESKLIIANNALAQADAIAQHRYAFANRAASALAEYANKGGAPGGLDRFFQSQKLHFAPNGQVEVALTIRQPSKKDITHHTQWHLKEGDNTTREGAARIYFCAQVIDGIVRVFVLFCGPHPPTSFKAFASLPPNSNESGGKTQG